MDDLRVPVRSLNAQLWFADGKVLNGLVYVTWRSGTVNGSAGMGEWTADASAFAPVRTSDGDVNIVSRANIVAVATTSDESHEGEDLVGVTRAVEIDTSGGLTFRGHLRITMPRESQRVADWVNTPETHVVLESDEVRVHVQKCHILRIREAEMPPALDAGIRSTRD